MMSKRYSGVLSAWDAWLAYAEQTARLDIMEHELTLMRKSRSWRMTAPLRAAIRFLGGRKLELSEPGRPMLRQPEQSFPAGSNEVQFTAPLDRIVSRIRTRDCTARMYVDVTALELEDLGAGIQRVTRRVLGALCGDPEIPFAPVAVCLRSDGHYYPACRFTERFLGLPAGCLKKEEPISPEIGDVLLGLDLCREFAEVLGPAWASLRLAGVLILPVVYDILPIERPDWFPERVSRELHQWLDVVSAHADLAICISDATRDSFVHALASSKRNVPPVVVVPMGADGLCAVIPQQIPFERSLRQVLMVGTIEPRKGYGDVLDVFERLWADGCDIRLVIVGHSGWKVDPLLQRIRKLAHGRDRLAWFDHADDRTLQGLYLSSSLLVAASEGEGFGLPIIEAATGGCHLLLRDLPVFREVARNDARYYVKPEDLDAALRQFSSGPESWPLPPQNLPSWHDTAEAICSHAARMTNRAAES